MGGALFFFQPVFRAVAQSAALETEAGNHLLVPLGLNECNLHISLLAFKFNLHSLVLMIIFVQRYNIFVDFPNYF